METIDMFLLFWLLPALCMFLFVIEYNRFKENLIPKHYDSDEWFMLIIVSLVWPVTLVGIVCVLLYTYIVEAYIPSLASFTNFLLEEIHIGKWK